MIHFNNLSRMLASCALCAVAVAASADDEFFDGADAYLAMKRPGDTPEIFAPGQLAEPGTFVMGRVAFSRDGKEFYYTQGDSWNSLEHAKIKLMRYTNGRWHEPAVVNEQFVSPTLSVDGDTLYFRKGNMNNVWLSRRITGGWSAAEPLIETSFGVYDFMPTRSGRFYVGSEATPDDAKHGSTYVFSRLAFTAAGVKVTSLGRPLNAKGYNGDFFVAPDESYMIVSANETPDYEAELYISFRRPDDTWSVPVSLGPKINNGVAHRWGQFVTADEKYLFYSYGTSEKDCAIYWVRFDSLLKKLRPREVSGSPSTSSSDRLAR
jgi:hypothetical protein